MGALWRLPLLVLSIFGSIQVIWTTGRVTVRLIKYSNPSNADQSGSSCDGFSSDKCDPLFKICYTALPATKSSCPIETGHYDNNNDITFGSKIKGNINNPLTFKFDHFDNALKLEISVDDYDSGFLFGENDHIDTVSRDFKTANPYSSHNPGTTLTLKGGRVSIELTVQLQCDQDYYGPGCKVFCRAQDAPTHYTCSHTGQKMCLSQWVGGDCDIWNYCHHHTCEHGATCINKQTTHTCSCSPGYKGSRCQIGPTTTTQTTTITSTTSTTTTTKRPTTTTATTTTKPTTTTDSTKTTSSTSTTTTTTTTISTTTTNPTTTTTTPSTTTTIPTKTPTTTTKSTTTSSTTTTPTALTTATSATITTSSTTISTTTTTVTTPFISSTTATTTAISTTTPRPTTTRPTRATTTTPETKTTPSSRTSTRSKQPSHVTPKAALSFPMLPTTTKPNTHHAQHRGVSVADLTLPLIMATGGVVALCSCVLMSALLYKRYKTKKKKVKPRPLPKAKYNFNRAPPTQRYWI